ncbi:MAG: bifunctional 3-deoxy-7-phosphoheptulonate synthase/chorismate mutase type II [Bdellovibrio sp.]|nr:bifunctional 3-deoxy-7-phosphoheptulonate synthase/chorismate mutase type II [Bdellovibrio sp.]
MNCKFDNHFHSTFLANWPKANNSYPFIIAGPCSAESKEQVLATAHELKKIPQIKGFRAGVWKPRTRPNSFEGMGEEALPWLACVKKETGLFTAVEVANPRHVELCLKHGIDCLWIGARTTAGPFAVQEIAEALKGTDAVVMVKNPVNAELSLWIGALERLNASGLSKLVAIHRGFSGAENNIFRNLPLWEVPLELKRHFPHLPLICDPSHIAGKRDLIERVSQMALDMDFDGLIIESHIAPDQALSDASQQITPSSLQEMLTRLEARIPSCNDHSYEESLEKERARIDRLDSELIEILLARMRVVHQIADIKAKHNVTALQINRMDRLMKNRTEYAQKIGLDPTYIERIFQIVHAESVRFQSDRMAQVKNEVKKPC